MIEVNAIFNVDDDKTNLSSRYSCEEEGLSLAAWNLTAVEIALRNLDLAQTLFFNGFKPFYAFL